MGDIMAERFDIHDQRSFYLAGIRELSEKIENIDRLRIAYELVRTAWSEDSKERAKGKPMYKKKMVYVLTVFFTEESGYDSEEYYADSYNDIERVKRKIYEDYPDVVDQIIVSDDKQEREFYI